MTFGAVACSKHKPSLAVGPNDEITVLTNTPRNGPVMTQVWRLLAYPVQVVGMEAAFRVDPAPYSDFKTHQFVKNQAFVVDLSKKDHLAKDLPRVLESAVPERYKAHEPFLSVVRDLWATGQSTLFAVAWSESDLVRLLAQCDSTDLRRSLEDAVVTGLGKTMFSLGEEKSIPAQVAREYGWTMRLPTGFYAADDPKGRFVKFNSEEPVRLILVHWEDGELPLDEATWNPVLSRTLWVYDDEDTFMPEHTRSHTTSFQGAPALRWEGVWQNEKYVIGGPFRALACHRDGRSFLLIGIVFAPGESKVPILRQVEAILNTFRMVG